MNLFFKKKKTACACSCGGCCAAKPTEIPDARIKILGSGCQKCNDLEKATKEALGMLNLSLPIDHVTDFGKIAAYGVMSTPALVVDEKVIAFGKVLSAEEVVALLAPLVTA